MPDLFGPLELPAQAPDLKADESVTDPRLDKIGAFLQAVLNADLNLAWSVVNPGRKFVEQMFTNDPSDSTFNERDLPSLFVYDPRSVTIQTTDDLVEDVSQLTVLWVPQNIDQARRSLRSTGVNGFKKSVQRAFYLGRHPAWFDIGDPDEDAPTYGSVLMTRAKLARWPFVRSAQVMPLTIITDGQAPRVYPGYSLTVQISEMTIWDVSPNADPSKGSVNPANAPPKVDITAAAGALTLESKIPTT